MAATVQILRKTGSGPTTTNVTGGSTVLATADDAAPGTTNPIPIPASGTRYSYWASFRLNCTVTPASLIDNLRFYTDGANSMGTGVGLVVATANSYVQATGTGGTTGTELSEANHGDLDAAPASAFDYTSGSPLTVAGSLSNPSTGEFGDHVVLQTTVASTASPGQTTSETITIAYDEV